MRERDRQGKRQIHRGRKRDRLGLEGGRGELFDKKSSLQNSQDCKGKSPHICRYSINFSAFYTLCTCGRLFLQDTTLCVFCRETMNPFQNTQFKKCHSTVVFCINFFFSPLCYQDNRHIKLMFLFSSNLPLASFSPRSKGLRASSVILLYD